VTKENKYGNNWEVYIKFIYFFKKKHIYAAFNQATDENQENSFM
jgi:hypothetical protein